jgi:hypothetical protein
VLRERLADRADRTLAPEGFTARLARLAPDQVAAEYEAVYAGAISRKGMVESVLPPPGMLAGRT